MDKLYINLNELSMFLSATITLFASVVVVYQGVQTVTAKPSECSTALMRDNIAALDRLQQWYLKRLSATMDVRSALDTFRSNNSR